MQWICKIICAIMISVQIASCIHVSCLLFAVRAELQKVQSLSDSEVVTNERTSSSDQKEDQSEPRPSNTCMYSV